MSAKKFAVGTEFPFKSGDLACRTVAQERRIRKKKAGLVDAVVNGERVLLHEPAKARESERSVETQARVAIAATGALVMKHSVERCPCCGSPPRKGTGLGHGASDLVCIVPPLGRLVFIEMKRPGYSPSDVKPHQECFLRAVARKGAIAGVASSVEEALALVAQARELP